MESKNLKKCRIEKVKEDRIVENMTETWKYGRGGNVNWGNPGRNENPKSKNIKEDRIVKEAT